MPLKKHTIRNLAKDSSLESNVGENTQLNSTIHVKRTHPNLQIDPKPNHSESASKKIGISSTTNKQLNNTVTLGMTINSEGIISG